MQKGSPNKDFFFTVLLIDIIVCVCDLEVQNFSVIYESCNAKGL